MKKSCMIALLVLTGGFGGPVVAESTDTAVTANTDKNAAGAAAAEKKICRSEKITGTRSKVRRTCRTRAEWDEIAEATRKNLNDFNREASGAAGPLAKNPFGG